MIVVGGTGPKAYPALVKQLRALEQPPDVFLVCPSGEGGYYDATCVGGNRSLDVTQLDAKVKKTLSFHKADPTFGKAWDETTINTVYALCDELKADLDAGKVLLITCVGGNNRSRMFAHAIDATQKPPDCVTMRKVCEAYRMAPEDRPNLAPLQPPARETRARA